MRVKLITVSTALLLVFGQLGSPAWAYKRVVHAEGVITSFDSYASSFALDTRRYGSGLVTVLVRENTALQPRVRDDDDEQEEIPFRRASLRDFREGDVVVVDGFGLRGNRILAAQIGIRSRGYAGPPFSSADPFQRSSTQGVVVAKDARTMTIREQDGRHRTIFVPTDARVTGDRASFSEIAVNDRVRVEGTATSDQSIVAATIAVASLNEFRVEGRITFISRYAPVFVLDDRFTVRVLGETQIVSGGQARSVQDLRIGQVVRAAGSPIVRSGIIVGMDATLIAF